MKKETLISIFKANKNSNFKITTNIGEGRGINGISFNEYYGVNYPLNQTTKIVGFMDDCLVLEVGGRGCYWDKGVHKIYISYDAILSVDFIIENGMEDKYPNTIREKHNLKEIK